MEELIMRKQPVACIPKSITPSPITMHKDSHTIAKVKPKIRIIHIFAPEIIKTDVANFRELVQRLTGKPTAGQKGGCRQKPRRARTQDQPRNCDDDSWDDKPIMNKKVDQLRSGFGSSLGSRERVKEEEEMWNIGACSGSFLGGFTDLDGFIQELGEFPLLPMDVNHMQELGQTQLA